jgi:hypothetical protein
MAKKKTEQENTELVAGKRYTICEKSKEVAIAKAKSLRQAALSQGLLSVDGGAIQFLRDKGKFFIAIRFNK